MRPLAIAGILVMAFGVIVIIRGLDYGSQRNVIQVGELRASVEARRSVPTWVAGAAIVGGALLVGAGLRRNPRGA